MMTVGWNIGLTIGVLLFTANSAVAQEFPVATEPNFTLDAYDGRPSGSATIVGMGGVVTAVSVGSAGAMTNPALAAVGLTGQKTSWNWDAHVDWSAAKLDNDHDNNGIETNRKLDFPPNFTFGLLGQVGRWGTYLAYQTQSTESDFEGTIEGADLITEVGTLKFGLARQFFDGQLVAGGALAIGVLFISEGEANTLIDPDGGGFEVGLLWKPSLRSFRIGATFRSAILTTDVDTEACDPLDCYGYVLPTDANFPWRATLGYAARVAPSAWNTQTKSPWRDEKALRWGVDLVVTGATRGGMGVEAFGLHRLQPSGRRTTVSLRLGAEYEWLPGRLRLQAGSYWEPSRFRDPLGGDVPGRIHGTAGLQYRFWSFHLAGKEYRLKALVAGDVARDVLSTYISAGLWH